MRDQIALIIADCPDTAIDQIGNLWRVRVERHCDAGEDGVAVAERLMGLWRWEKQEDTMQVGHMDEPEDLEIPRFLEPEPDPLIPAELHSLSEPGETVREMQARLWLLYLELQNKVMMALASREEIRLHTTLHGHLNWLAPPLEGDL
jgi:hypothetical protein